MTNLQQFQSEIVIDNTTGESFMSLSGLARVCGRNKSTISDFASVRFCTVKTAEVLTAAGLRSVRLLNEETIAEAIAAYNPELAKKLLVLGVRKLLHELAGWKAVEKPMSQMQMIASMATEIHNQNVRLEQTEKDVNRLKQFAPTEDYYTLTAYYNYRKKPWDKSRSAAKDGKELVKLSKLMLHDVKPVHDARYNNVNSYHKEVLQEYLGF